MSYLTVNGVAVPVAYGGQPTRTRVYVGGRGERNYNGRPSNNAHANLWDFKGRTPLMDYADSAVYRTLLEGEGHILDFELTDDNTTGLATSRGTMPSDIGGGEVLDDIPGFPAKYGTGYLVTDATGSSWDLGLGANWTVMAWRRINLVWQHCALSSSGDHFYNGVVGTPPDAADTTWADVTDGVVTLATRNSHNDFDDVVVLPYAADEWMPALYAFHASRAFPALPLVVANGRATHSTATTVLATIGDAQHNDVGSLRESFDFTLIESPD